MEASYKRVCIGKISGVHGIQGAVRIHVFTEDPADITAYGNVGNADGSQIYSIKVRSTKKDIAIATIKGVDTRDEAEKLRGTKLYVERENLPSLENEEFYIEDMVGADVFRVGREGVYGEVIAVYNYGASDIIEVRVQRTEKEEMFVFTQDVVPEVNLDEGYIIVDPLEVMFVSDNDNELSEK